MAKTSSVPDHCRQYSLSDPLDSDFQWSCDDHTHQDICDRCEELTTVEAISKMPTHSVSEDITQELLFFSTKRKIIFSPARRTFCAQWPGRGPPGRPWRNRLVLRATCTRLGNEILSEKISRKPEWLVRQDRPIMAHYSGHSTSVRRSRF